MNEHIKEMRRTNGVIDGVTNSGMCRSLFDALLRGIEEKIKHEDIDVRDEVLALELEILNELSK